MTTRLSSRGALLARWQAHAARFGVSATVVPPPAEHEPLPPQADLLGDPPAADLAADPADGAGAEGATDPATAGEPAGDAAGGGGDLLGDGAGKPQKPDDPDLLTSQIVAAIGTLDAANGDHFGASGMPNVKAIEAVLGYDITAAERTAAWRSITDQPDQEAGSAPRVRPEGGPRTGSGATGNE